MNYKKKAGVTAVILIINFLAGVAWVQAEYLDRIVAVAEEDVILDSELNSQVNAITQKMAGSNMQMPPQEIIRKQVLERIIIDKLQSQLAKRSGIRVSDEMLENYIADIAQRNQMNPVQFKEEMKQQGMNYSEFVESVRNEIIINQLRGREIGGRIKVTEREVDHYMETRGKAGNTDIQYHLGHILIAVQEGASAMVIQKANAKADKLVQELRGGKDFKQTALGLSDGGQALAGGDLGWRSMAQIPTLFVDEIEDMAVGQISDPIRSPSGFHIIKILGIKGLDEHVVTQTDVRHILIKTNELIDDKEAEKRLYGLRERIMDGDDFGILAKANSDDKGSAIKGGNLGWVLPGALVKPFEDAMNELAIKELSEPVQTQFGWHLIQVLARKERDNSEEHKRNKAREEIRTRKIEEETELWLRRLRDEAYVDIRLDN